MWLTPAWLEGREVIALWSAPPPRKIEGYPAGEEAWTPPLGVAERRYRETFLRSKMATAGERRAAARLLV